jgi:hypothetical protein
MKRIAKSLIGGMFLCFSAAYTPSEKITLVSDLDTPTEQYGVEKLRESLKSAGYNVFVSSRMVRGTQRQVIVGKRGDRFISDLLTRDCVMDTLSREGFVIRTKGKKVIAAGGGENGELYACLELTGIVRKDGKLPERAWLTDQPEMGMRGTCIGLQKTTYLQGRTVYEYPYTPENFPWFYDRDLWIRYLDMMVENRFNSLYLWNGHPFASLVKLKDYPYAVEVNDETFRKNEDIFGFLTTEAGRRGIFVIQMFYNIIVSKPFAEYHQISTQDRNRPITPLISDYTRKSVAAFIEKYPNVGLLVTLGEAMNTIDDDVEWFTKTILPGVKDGLKALGRSDEPPIVLRGHDTDARRVMEEALPVYKNLFTMHKYNGESLTTYEPRDSWESIPRALSEIGTLHISNVHILANLEPFRYGSPDFIQKCVLAMHQIQKAGGIHLYPQASYWDWPYTADKTEPRLLQIDRDRIWYQAWGRYAWNCHRDRNREIQYWTEILGERFGCGENGKHVLEAYEETGEIAPKLLRTFGISDGNRQTLLLGMFMSQLVNPLKYNVYSNFWTSSGPEKEVLLTYAEKAWKGEPHHGETPPQIADEVESHARKAVEAIEKAAGSVSVNREEFNRFRNDILCYRAIAGCMGEKVRAAMLILRFGYSGDVADLEKAIPHIAKSLEYYEELVKLTENTYLYANSMQTRQRRIPVTGINGTNKTWAELLPQYRTEFMNFKRNVDILKQNGSNWSGTRQEPFVPAGVTILTEGAEPLYMKKGEPVYSDRSSRIDSVAGELVNLTGVMLNSSQQQDDGTLIRFENKQAVKVLVGYFNGNSYSILPPPTLETNAQANDRGQADVRIANALHIPGLYPVNVYSYDYPPGIHELSFGKGMVLILGFIDGSYELVTRDAGVGMGPGVASSVDWLFY